MGSRKKSTFSLFVDRIEGEMAVLLLPETKEIVLPVKILPPKVREGDYLLATLEVDPQKTAQMQKKVSKLVQRLGQKDEGGDIEL